MANEEHLRAIKQGVKVWNAWIDENHVTIPDLFGADLKGLYLSGANLIRADLRGADLSGSDLSKAYLAEAALHGANLCDADLRHARIGGADLSTAKLCRANLSFARITQANLRSADLRAANLSEANLGEAILSQAYLYGVNLFKAELRYSDITGADLSYAQCQNADLSQTNLSYSNLTSADFDSADFEGSNLLSARFSETNLRGATVGGTIFADNDLSTVKGLLEVRHRGPSTIGIDTLFKSDGKIPEVFLRGAGVPEDFITFVPSLAGRAIEFYSCFISYSHQDEEFSQRLHSRMRSENLRVWYAPEDMKGGRKLHEEIFRAIQIHDKLLLVLSENSMKSEWVTTEIRRGQESRAGRESA